MQRMILAAIALCICAAPIAAQRGSGMPGAHPAGHYTGTRGSQPARSHPPEPWSNAPAEPRFPPLRIDSREFRPSLFPGAYYSPYAGYADYDLAPPASAPAVVVLLTPPPPAPPPPAPPAPVRAHIQEYTWTQPGAATARTFAIVLKDGTVKRVQSVCRQDALLTFIAADGMGDEVEFSAIDREATRRANGIDLMR